jgi:DNA-binding Lrp family transcriptional regulator
MILDKLGLDERDRTILSLLQQDSTMSQSEIAKKIKLSQPSVGMRIQKLKERGILSSCLGMNFKDVKLFLAKVDVSATDTDKVLRSFEQCPFFLNGLVVSGTKNLCLFIAGPDMKVLEEVINYHVRSHPNVTDVKMDMVIKPAKDLVFPVAVQAKVPKGKKEFKEKCHSCPCREQVFCE